MNLKTFSFIAAVVFSGVSLLHLARILFGGNVLIENWEVPMPISMVAFIVSAYLAYKGFQLSSRGENKMTDTMLFYSHPMG